MQIGETRRAVERAVALPSTIGTRVGVGVAGGGGGGSRRDIDLDVEPWNSG